MTLLQLLRRMRGFLLAEKARRIKAKMSAGEVIDLLKDLSQGIEQLEDDPAALEILGAIR